MSAVNPPLVPLYTTYGDVGAILRYPYLFNPRGEWIGTVTAAREVFSIYGTYVGQISKEWRIIRPRSLDSIPPARKPLKNPGSLVPPAHFPLPSLMPELTPNLIDVLEEAPELLPAIDSGEFKPDLD
ncbi:MAG TPA: hypothetical protein VN363_00350 [Anaerolineales bacterium]|nr:hypothetical protein [Anaerolineales bacterium]